MIKTRNRLTPFLVIILILELGVWCFVFVHKLRVSEKIGIRKYKLEDPLIQELYQNITDEDIKYYAEGKHDVNSLTSGYIFSKATKNMTVEDFKVENKMFYITYDALDFGIKIGFGPDFKYDLSSINGLVNTYFEINDKPVNFNVKYDSLKEEYTGLYSYKDLNNEIFVKRKLVQATKNREDDLNLKIEYAFYKKSNKLQVCEDYRCEKIIKEVTNIDDVDYTNTMTVVLNKASDDLYYYAENK